MNIIIPLAGVDIYNKLNETKNQTDGKTYLEYVLSKRSWMHDNKNEMVFIIRHDEAKELQLINLIKYLFPRAKLIILNFETRGAIFSSLSGVASFFSHNAPLVIDLADIGFQDNFNIIEIFSSHLNIKSIVPFFNSKSEKFSYMNIEDGYVTKLREKENISNFASAGLYIFRETSDFLDCTAYAINNPKICSINGVYYICPSLNFFPTQNDLIFPIRVDVENYGKNEI